MESRGERRRLRGWGRIVRGLAIAVAGILVAMTGWMQASVQYQTVRPFGFPDQMGQSPHAPVNEGSDGVLYGTTYQGGSDGVGTVYRLNRDGTGYSVVRNFLRGDGDGQYPFAGLVEGSDGVLYGTTQSGGSGSAGAVFKLNKNGTGYSVLRSFLNDGADGLNPRAGLVEGSDGILYGTTEYGGSADRGTVFKVNKDGTGYSVLRSFLNDGGDGQNPVARLVEGSDGVLYGTTFLGGSDGFGTVYKLNKDGTGYSVLRSFLNDGADGLNPRAGLVEGSDGILYGTTTGGGSVGGGAVFKLNKDGTGYSLLRSILTTGGDGQGPLAGLVEGSDGVLYGTTYRGGSADRGTVFKVNKDGTGYSVLRSFLNDGGDGQYPRARLVEGSDGVLYGMNEYGGSANQGTVFKLNRDGTGYSVVRSFTGGADGGYPYAGLVEGSDGVLYGTTYRGGSGSVGTVFKLNKDGTSYSVLHSFQFSGSDGQNPRAGLVEDSDGVLYGTTTGGGSENVGTVFKLNKDGTGYSVLRSFLLSGGDGRYPYAGLSEGSDGVLYGTTYGGGSENVGTIFKLNKDGTGYSVLRSFLTTGGDGQNPYAGLVEGSDGILYGTTYGGGSRNVGTVFKLNKNGTGYSVVRSFLTADGDGWRPQALMEGSDGVLYGTTYVGGSAEIGTVFKIAFTKPPVLGTDLLERTWGFPLQVHQQKLLQNDSDPQGSALSISAFSTLSPNGATISSLGNYLVYIPLPGFNGTDSFTYTVANVFGDTAVATVTIIVTASTALAVSVESGIATIRFAGIPSTNYDIEACDDLVAQPKVWVRLDEVVAATDGLFQYIDADAGNYPMRFYRSRRP